MKSDRKLKIMIENSGRKGETQTQNICGEKVRNDKETQSREGQSPQRRVKYESGMLQSAFNELK